MANVITVKATATDSRVVVWEKDPDHPTGEIFISGNGREHQVALTTQVKRLVSSGALVEVGKTADDKQHGSYYAQESAKKTKEASKQE